MRTYCWDVERIYADGRRERLRDQVVGESPLCIVINGEPLVELMRMPGRDRELAVGFCLTEGMISSVEDVLLLREWDDEEIAAVDPYGYGKARFSGSGVVELRVRGEFGAAPSAAWLPMRRGSGGLFSGQSFERQVERIKSDASFPIELMHRLGERLTRRQKVFRSTGGTHGAAVFSRDGVMLEMAEDVGRHNAVDKVVGACAIFQVCPRDKLLFITGRVSYEMVRKTVRAGFPCLASLAAPTHLGLDLASELGLTVVGFVNRRRFNVYTHGWRLGG